MGLTYYPKAEKIAPFSVNSSGATLLGFMHQAAKASLFGGPDDDNDTPRVPYRQFAGKCEADAAILTRFYSDSANVHELWKKTGQGDFTCHSMKMFEFDAWLNDWIRFLAQCDGYSTEG